MSKFSQEAINYAKYTEKVYGVPSAVTLAQYALESNYGQSRLAKTNNNFFGIKNPKTGGFKSYNSMYDSFVDHAKLLNKPLYADKTKGAKTSEEYIQAIAETYAPSSDGNTNYVGKIMKIINDNNLDSGGVVSTGTGEGSGESTESTTGGGFSFMGNLVKSFVVFFVVIAALFFFYQGVT